MTGRLILLCALAASGCERPRGEPVVEVQTEVAGVSATEPTPPSPPPAPREEPAAVLPPGPRWVSGPDRAYNCTRYLRAPNEFPKAAQVAVGSAMDLVLPPGKPMKLRLVAKPAPGRRGPVTFELEHGPPRATLDAAGQFAWTVDGTASQRIDFAFVAVGDDGGRTPWPMSITIADDLVRTAWRAGMGSAWPDCDVVMDDRFTVMDFDGDGKDDAMYKQLTAEDDSTTHLMLQRGTAFTEAYTCDTCWPATDIAIDGTRLLVETDDCCCMFTMTIARLDGDAYVDVQDWQVPSDASYCDPDSGFSVTLQYTDGRVSGVEERDHGGHLHVRWKWRHGRFE